MPKTAVKNDTTDNLRLWLEPWSSDHWMYPGDRFTITTDGPCFETVIHEQGISIWVNAGTDAQVVDRDGNEVPCGHQRPIEALREWLVASERALETSSDRSPKVQELTRSHRDQLQRMLEDAEAAQAAGNLTVGSSQPTTQVAEKAD